MGSHCWGAEPEVVDRLRKAPRASKRVASSAGAVCGVVDDCGANVFRTVDLDGVAVTAHGSLGHTSCLPVGAGGNRAAWGPSEHRLAGGTAPASCQGCEQRPGQAEVG